MNEMNMIISGMLILTFFIFSALITGSMVFVYPVKLFFIEGKSKQKAIQIVLFTTLWLVIIFITISLSSVVIWQLQNG